MKRIFHKSHWILILVCLSSSLLQAQKENNNWHFGEYAGLDFNTPIPTPFKSVLYALEGTSCISDQNGELLFFTNGVTIWDRHQDAMPNAFDLAGNTSSTQAALIAPLPNSTSIYYVFTNVQKPNSGLSYSIVDLNLNGGLGDVIAESKNTLLADSTGEKLIGILHQNQKDIWIITHLVNSNAFQAFLLTSSGLQTTPVISEVGSFHNADEHIGPLKASHDGLKIVSTVTASSSKLDIFDFNSCSGKLYNPINLSQFIQNPLFTYGIEFSPSNNLLYLGSFSQQDLAFYIHQLNLQSHQLRKIYSQGLSPYGGALELGPDQKIYYTNQLNTYLGVIQEPNIEGTGCQFDPEGVALYPGSRAMLGFPNSVRKSSSEILPIDISIGPDRIACKEDSVILKVTVPPECDTPGILWSDGSTTIEHTVWSSGEYWVEVSCACTIARDTIQIDFVIDCPVIVYYDLEACDSYMDIGTNMDYSEFVPSYPNPLQCASVEATNLYRTNPQEHKHSCTPGLLSGEAMCISSSPSLVYLPGDNASLIAEVTLEPNMNEVVQLSGFEFLQKSPLNYNWIDGDSGPNNFPTQYGIRILKNDSPIFQQTRQIESHEWTLESYDLFDDSAFRVDQLTTFKFELFPFSPINNGALVSAWDLDELKIYGACLPDSQLRPIIQGVVTTTNGQKIPDVEIRYGEEPLFQTFGTTRTDSFGLYQIVDSPHDKRMSLMGYKNDDMTNGINTLDIVLLQKHLLGIQPFKGLPQYVAADINHSGTVNMQDLTELRKIILGIYNLYPYNTSWRFGVLPQNFQIPDISSFSEIRHIESHGDEVHVVDFVGIKIGDLTGNAKTHSRDVTIQDRSHNSFAFTIDEKMLTTGVPEHIKFKASGDIRLIGMQFTIDLKGMEFISIQGNIIPIDMENFSLIDGQLRVSWNADESINIRKEDILFTLEVMPSKSDWLSSLFKYFGDKRMSELYSENLEIFDLTMAFNSKSSGVMPCQMLTIAPNPVRSESKIDFYLPEDGQAEIRFFDISGRILHSSQNNYSSGMQSMIIPFDKIGFRTGILGCQVLSNGCMLSNRFVLIE